VLPELNAFGNAFRNRGYRLDGAPKYGTTILALREQVGYTADPGPDSTRRWDPAGAILGAVEVGRVEAFMHESLGSGGGPSSLFLDTSPTATRTPGCSTARVSSSCR